MKKLLDSLLYHLFFSRKAKRDLRNRRFIRLHFRICQVTNWDQIEEIRHDLDLLSPEDKADPRYDTLQHELEMVNADITHDWIRMQNQRIKYGESLLKKNGII